jgi:hypothetical protein
LKLGSEDVELAGQADLQPASEAFKMLRLRFRLCRETVRSWRCAMTPKERARGLYRESLAGELVAALLGMLGPTAVGKVVVGRIRTRASQQGLADQQSGARRSVRPECH